jgi:hypothetical protein
VSEVPLYAPQDEPASAQEETMPDDILKPESLNPHLLNLNPNHPYNLFGKARSQKQEASKQGLATCFRATNSIKAA